MEESTTENKYCSKCGEELTKTDIFCSKCGERSKNKVADESSQVVAPIKTKAVSGNKIKCPKCQSDNIIGGKKGFSGANAVGGAILTGGIGILAGTIGSNKVELSCLSCGKKFKPGEDLRSVRKKKHQQAKANSDPKFWVFLIVIAFTVFLLLKAC